MSVIKMNVKTERVFQILTNLMSFDDKGLNRSGGEFFLKEIFQVSSQTNKKFGHWLCCFVGRAVASDYRGPRFESSHRPNFIYIEHLFTVNYVLKRQT